MPGPIKRKIKKKSETAKNAKNCKQGVGLGDGQKRTKRKEKALKCGIKRKGNLRKTSKKSNKSIKESNFGKQTSRPVEGRQAIKESSKSDCNSCISTKKYSADFFINTGKLKAKVRKSPAKSSLLYLKNPFQDEENPSESLESTAVTLDESETVFVSLDFLEECNTYKAKFRKLANPSELKSLQKRVRKISSYHDRYLDKIFHASQEGTRTGSKVTKYYTSRIKKKTKPKLKTKNARKKEVPTKKKKHEEGIRKSEKGLHEVEEQKQKGYEENDQNELSESYIKLWPSYSNNLIGEENIAKVDEKYIQSLLSITKNKEEEMKQENKTKGEEIQNHHSKGKIIGIVKNRKKKKENKMKNKSEVAKAPSQISNETEDTSVIAYKDYARLVREQTKSELLFKEKIRAKVKERGKYLGGQEMKSEKKIAHSRITLGGHGKKRKSRNHTVKREDNELIEIPFPCEVSKKEDIKELWRREDRKESENSLSSHSSCTPAEESPSYDMNNLGMESFKTLQKIVEEEVHRISKKYISEQKESEDRKTVEKAEEIASKPNDEKAKEVKTEKKIVKNICQQLKMATPRNFGLLDTEDEKLDLVVKKRIMQAENQQKLQSYPKEKKEKSLSGLPDKEKLQGITQLKFSQEKDINGKLPGEIVKNWSVLRRLEKAFIALGTPTFPGKNGKEFSSSPQKLRGVGVTEKNIFQTDGGQLKKLKESEAKTTKFVEALNKRNPVQINNEKFEGEKIKKVEDPEGPFSPGHQPRKETFQIRKETLMKGRKSQKTDIVYLNKSKKPDDDENVNNVRQRKGKVDEQLAKTPNTEKPLMKTQMKPNPLTRGDAEMTRSRQTRKESLSPKKPSEIENFDKSKSSRVLASNFINEKDSETVTLERKRTFEILSNKGFSIVPLRKSKSCNKVDESSDPDNCFTSTESKLAFPETTLDFWYVSDRNLKESQNIGKRVSKTETEQPMKVAIVKKSSQNQPTETVVQERRSRSDADKENAKGVLGNTPKQKIVKPEVVGEPPRQILLKRKEITTDGKENRAVKKRSILSMRENRHRSKTPLTNNPQIEVPKVPSIIKSTTIPFGDKKDSSSTEEEDTKQVDSSNSQSNQSHISTTTYVETENVDSPDIKESRTISSHLMMTVPPRISGTLTYFPSLTSSITDNIDSSYSIQEEREQKGQHLWEHDLTHYRAIVTDILNHYERLGGLLKQGQNLVNFQCEFNSGECIQPTDEESHLYHQHPEYFDIHDYRKKIMSEYSALPILEYKSKIQNMKKKSKAERNPERILEVATSLDKEMDVDVKDYQITNIQKVLDSQIYIESKKFCKKHETCPKDEEKTWSLQEVIQGPPVTPVKQQEWPRASSVPKTLLLPSKPLSQDAKEGKNAFVSNTSTRSVIPSSDLESMETDANSPIVQ